MAITANDLRKGMAIRHQNDVVVVLDVAHRTPGNLRAFVQATLRSIATGKSAVHRFSSTERVEDVMMNRQKLEFSYKDQSGYNFIDPNTYETVVLQDDLVGDAKSYLVENVACDILYVESRPVSVELPSSVSIKVTEAPEGIRGDSANNVNKTVLLETGMEIQAPLFIKEGEVIKVDTRTGAYMGRA